MASQSAIRVAESGSQATVLEKTIPPPLATQSQIVAELEAERKLVEANRGLSARMEAKVKAKLAEVWGETGRRNRAAVRALLD